MNTIAITLILWIVFIILCLIAFYIFLSIRKYLLKNKTRGIKTDLSHRISTTKELLDLIDTLITTEIISQCKTVFFSKNEKYNYRLLDDDAKVISTNVFKALSSDIFSKYNIEIITKTDYLMSYITKRTLELLLETVTEYNSKLI